MQITASNWQLLSPLLDDALLLAPEARIAWLAEQTHLTAANRAHLAQMIALANAPETDHLFQELTGVIAAPERRYSATAHAGLGDIVGPYQLLRLLGRGGMAEVWLARRSDGAYVRDVALKLPLAHLPHNVATERLLRERNVLAALEHPAIARLYDAGIAANGQPYLAMEYVEGESIVSHANRLKLGLKARCKLMLDVLDALHYAHQHLVVHRDLKPSNIMVRLDGRVTLLDFGIAKVLESATAASQATELTQVAGSALTLAYAAPEQLLAEPVTTATDLYSVGVVMFELLTGARPFAQAERSPSALLQAIDTSPVPLQISGNDEGAQSHGHETAAAWQRAYRGDLAAICARALRREPAARYASALSMREDLARYFDDQPVQARSGAWTYRWRKFFDRNRAAILVSTFAATAAIGFGTHAWQQTQDSRLSAARVTATENVVKSLFDGMNPNSNTPRTFTAKELLDKTRPLLAAASVDSADSRSKTALMMGRLYLDIGAFAEATQLFEDEIVEARAAGDVRREVWAQCSLADVHLEQGKFQLAFDNILRAKKQLASLATSPSLLSAELDYRLGSSALFLRNFSDANRYLAGARNTLNNTADAPVETLANVLIKQGSVAQSTGDLVAARNYFLDAQTRLQQTSGLQLTKDALAIEMLPLALAMGHFDEVIGQSELLLDRLATQASTDNSFAAVTTSRYITALIRTGKLREARERIDSLTTLAAGDKQFVSTAKNFSTLIALYTGESSLAMREFNMQLATPTGIAANSALTLSTRRNIAHSMLQLGSNAEALATLRSIEATQTALFSDPQHVDTAYTRLLLSVALIRQNELREASALLTQARDAVLAKRGNGHWAAMLADAYLALIAAAQSASTAPTAQSLVLADRVQRELGWQHGAPELAARLKSATRMPLNTVPALL